MAIKLSRKLITEWDRRLKASGFDDIEDRSTGKLRGDGHNVGLEAAGGGVYFQDHPRALYYRLADQAAHDFIWQSETDEVLWRLHCQGLSAREIAQQLHRPARSVQRRIAELQKAVLR